MALGFHFVYSLVIAYLDVRDDKTETNWLLVDYVSDTSNTLQLTKKGTNGLAELVEHLDDTKGSYAYVRVSFSNDKESKREKFIFVVGIIPRRIRTKLTKVRKKVVDRSQMQDYEKSQSER